MEFIGAALDLATWKIMGVDIASIVGELPMQIVVYDIKPEPGGAAPAKHRARDKRYFFYAEIRPQRLCKHPLKKAGSGTGKRRRKRGSSAAARGEAAVGGGVGDAALDGSTPRLRKSSSLSGGEGNAGEAPAEEEREEDEGEWEEDDDDDDGGGEAGVNKGWVKKWVGLATDRPAMMSGLLAVTFSLLVLGLYVYGSRWDAEIA
jgi:hypothetical protein